MLLKTEDEHELFTCIDMCICVEGEFDGRIQAKVVRVKLLLLFFKGFVLIERMRFVLCVSCDPQ